MIRRVFLFWSFNEAFQNRQMHCEKIIKSITSFVHPNVWYSLLIFVVVDSRWMNGHVSIGCNYNSYSNLHNLFPISMVSGKGFTTKFQNIGANLCYITEEWMVEYHIQSTHSLTIFICGPQALNPRKHSSRVFRLQSISLQNKSKISFTINKLCRSLHYRFF